MEANKTQPTAEKVTAFLLAIQDEGKRNDCRKLIDIMGDITGEGPVMWGASIVGFGSLHYKYPSGREGDTPLLSFSPRKQAITLYGVIFYDNNRGLLGELGPHKTGKGCMYIKALSDIKLDVLIRMMKSAYDHKGDERSF